MQMKHSNISSLLNCELNSKITQNEINDVITQIQDSKIIINIHSFKSITTKMINFDRILQIHKTFHLDESSNLSIFGMNYSFSNNAIESCKEMLVSWIIPDYIAKGSRNSIQLSNTLSHFRGFYSIGTANSDVFLPPKFSRIIKHFTPVQLAGDAPPSNGYLLPDLNLSYNPNDDANNANGNGGDPNEPPPPVNHGNGGGGGHNIGNGGGGGGGGGVNGLNNLMICRCNELLQPVERITTTIIANNYKSWNSFAGAVYAFYLSLHGTRMGNRVPDVLPSDCWPGSSVNFGRVDGAGNYTDLSWPEHAWQNVRAQINFAYVS